MSYMPQLKTSSIGDGLRRNYRTERSTNNNILSPRVRFSSNSTSSRTPITNSQRERERRKNQALDFLKKETGGISKPKHSTLRKPIGDTTTSRASAAPNKQFNDIPAIPSKSVLYDDNTLKYIRKESLRRNPLLSSLDEETRSTRSSDTSNRYKLSRTPKYMNNTGLLNSLGKFGSKVLNSILYSEDATNVEDTYSRTNPTISLSPIHSADPRSKRLEAELQATELELQVAERKRYLGQLNQEIDRLEKTKGIENISIDKQIGNLDNRLQNILEEVNSSSNTKLLSELGSIKEELTSLRRKQETNNIKFESKFEDMIMENQINRQKFDKLYKDLEEKRKQLDLEKNTLIRLLKDSKPITQETTENTGGIIKDDLGDSPSGDDDYDDEEDEARDILRYLMKHKRKRNTKSRSRLRQIRNNLDNIEKVTNK